MSLVTFLDNVKESLEEELEDWSVDVLIGDDQIDKNGNAPRVVFVPGGSGDSRIEKPKQSAGFPSRSILTIRENLVVHIWGAARTVNEVAWGEFQATEYLRDRVLVALRNSAYGAIDFQSGRWLPKETGRHGRVFIFSCSVDIPVLEAATAKATVHTVETKTAMLATDGSELALDTTTVTDVEEEEEP